MTDKTTQTYFDETDIEADNDGCELQTEHPGLDSILLASSAQQNTPTPSSDESLKEVFLGNVEAIDANGQVLVSCEDLIQSTPASSLVTLTKQDINKQVAIMFVNGNVRQPLILGVVHSPLQTAIEHHSDTLPGNLAISKSHHQTMDDNDVLVDGEKVVIEGKKEVVLKCGDASITLNESGKIMIRGKYLLNRASGLNRIMGASVQVN